MIVVEHRDLLGRMNTELAEAALSAHGRRLVVLDNSGVTGVLTSFCAHLYGHQSARNRNRALTAVGCARHDAGPRAGREAGSVRCGGGG